MRGILQTGWMDLVPRLLCTLCGSLSSNVKLLVRNSIRDKVKPYLPVVLIWSKACCVLTGKEEAEVTDMGNARLGNFNDALPAPKPFSPHLPLLQPPKHNVHSQAIKL